MLRLALIQYSMIATTLPGIAVIAVLSAGCATWVPIIAAAGLGFVAAIPASVVIAKKIQGNMI